MASETAPSTVESASVRPRFMQATDDVFTLMDAMSRGTGHLARAAQDLDFITEQDLGAEALVGAAEVMASALVRSDIHIDIVEIYARHYGQSVLDILGPDRLEAIEANARG